jgi:uncharacterized YigZ family protein
VKPSATNSGYLIPDVVHRAEQTIDRSRFTCTLAHAATTVEARVFIATIRAEWPEATHHCTAWVAGPPGDSNQVGMSDDGEPHGTAGRPMLNVLLHSDVGEIVAVVTRWYGGVKLGTGGLARAYSGSVELALDTLKTVEKVNWQQLELVASYSHVSVIRRLLPEHKAEVISEDFGTEVRFVVRVPSTLHHGLVTALNDATRGQVKLETES